MIKKMKINLIKGVCLRLKKNCLLEGVVSFRENVFKGGEVLMFEGYDGRFSSVKMCVLSDGECDKFLCGEDKIDELFEVVEEES